MQKFDNFSRSRRVFQLSPPADFRPQQIPRLFISPSVSPRSASFSLRPLGPHSSGHRFCREIHLPVKMSARTERGATPERDLDFLSRLKIAGLPASIYIVGFRAYIERAKFQRDFRVCNQLILTRKKEITQACASSYDKHDIRTRYSSTD